jgi:hypothetical protein
MTFSLLRGAACESATMVHDGSVFESRLAELGLLLPEPPKMPAGVATTFSWVRVSATV